MEARITSRALIDQGDVKLAYQLASNYRAASPAKKAEAEFHAGWYALRFLKQPAKARKHFENILRISKRPISQARGYYWLARASGAGVAENTIRLLQNTWALTTVNWLQRNLVVVL